MNRISQQDLAAALLCIGIGLFGVFMTLDLPIGNARRMGPGYMPMGAFLLLTGLGIAILVGSFLGEHDKLAKWWWRETILILGALTLFGVLLDRIGLMAAIAVTILVAMLAERPPQPKRMAFITPVLCAMCYVIFIAGLDIRVPVWPWSP